MMDQDTLHGRAGDAQTLKAPQISRDPPRFKVISLPKIENLRNDFPGCRPGERRGAHERSNSPASPWALSLAFHLMGWTAPWCCGVVGGLRNPEMTHDHQDSRH
jgi:hypothetical protein